MRDFINEGSWYAELLEAFFEEEMANAIKVMHIANHNVEDLIIWRGNNRGTYGETRYVCDQNKKAEHLSPYPRKDVKWKALWASEIFPKWKTFLWKLFNDALPIGWEFHREKCLLGKITFATFAITLRICRRWKPLIIYAKNTR